MTCVAQLRCPRWLLLAMIAFRLLAPHTLTAQSERKATRLADGVYVIEHQDKGDGSASGNTTVIIGERQVFVVDSGFLPSDAKQDISQIRQWTDRPVTFLLNTHFHNDHNFGNRIYLDAFPALTIIAHSETKKDMDRFGPGSVAREEKGRASLQQMLDTAKTPKGHELTPEETKEVKDALAQRTAVINEMQAFKFQSATLTFDHDFAIDLGGREVQVKFLGRGNTAGDAVLYLPKEKIVVAGDLVVYPIPYIYDGYPTEWVQTLQSLSQLPAVAVVPGHGPVLHDMAYVLLIRDLLQSAVAQVDAKLVQIGPAMFHTVEEVRPAVDLTSLQARFAGTDKDQIAAFNEMTTQLVKVVFEEASLR